MQCLLLAEMSRLENRYCNQLRDATTSSGGFFGFIALVHGTTTNRFVNLAQSEENFKRTAWVKKWRRRDRENF